MSSPDRSYKPRMICMKPGNPLAYSLPLLSFSPAHSLCSQLSYTQKLTCHIVWTWGLPHPEPPDLWCRACTACLCSSSRKLYSSSHSLAEAASHGTECASSVRSVDLWQCLQARSYKVSKDTRGQKEGLVVEAVLGDEDSVYSCGKWAWSSLI